MKFRNILTAMLLCTAFSVSSAQVMTDFKQDVKDLKQQLDLAVAKYEKNDISAVRRTLQSAYLNIFEGMESAIRMYVSAQKMGELEKELSIKMPRNVKNKIQLADFKKQIEIFKKELDVVLPQIQGKSPLKSGSDEDVKSAIADKWQEVLNQIEDGLAGAITSYRENDAVKAAKIAKDTQFKYYKGAELETSVRRYKSSKQASEINAQFTDLIQLIKKAKPLQEVAYAVSNLMQDLTKLLPNLPVHEKKSVHKN